MKKTFPDSKVYVFGLNDDKLADFTFADGAYKTTEVPEGFTMDHAFECVGGNGSPIAIEQIIGLIKPRPPFPFWVSASTRCPSIPA